jgi:hypothetical protein
MAQALTLQKLTIHCDACGHEFEGKVDDWHNKPCPACAAPNIIDDEDVAMHKVMMATAGLINGLCGDIAEGHSATFHFDSSKSKGSNANSAP